MSRKSIIILGWCFVCPTMLMIGLYAATHKIVHQQNSFLREYRNSAVTKSNEMDIEFNSWYIAGATADHIYLGNATAPFKVLIVNTTLTDSQVVTIQIRHLKKPTIHKSATVRIVPPYFYLTDGIDPVIYHGKLGDWVAERLAYDTNAYFTQIIPIGNHSFAIRTNESGTMNNILGKVQLDSPYLQLKAGLLEKQIDGTFCTDGMLLFNEHLQRLLYIYYYRNEYFAYDTNLNLDFRGHTIDTFSRAQIKVGYVSSSNTKKLLEKTFVNLKSCTSGKYLYIRSNLAAKNDVQKRVQNESIIDVYDLRTHSYHFSFSLPSHNSESKVRDFAVVDNKTLIALYDHFIVKFDLVNHYF